MTGPKRALLLAIAASLGVQAGCTKRKDGGTTQTEKPQPTVDVTADREAARQSWLVGLAKDSAPLLSLAKANAGWRDLFTGSPRAALEAFDGATDADARIARALAALELAEAYLALAELLQAATPALLKAQATRPDAASTAPWRAFIEARLTGKAAGIDGPAMPLGLALADPSSGLGALLAGRAEDVDVELPAGATRAWGHRLAMRALAGAGRIAEAQRRMKALDPRAPDFEVGAGDGRVVLRDPGAADAEARVYAAIVEDALRDVPGWPGLLRARALRILGRPGEAMGVAETLATSPPADAPLSFLVFSGALNTAELVLQARALAAVSAFEAGQVDKAASLIAAIKPVTIADRVTLAWANAFTDRPVQADAFPEDRGEYVGALVAEVAALGAAAAGGEDVQQLGLVDRHADVVQRRYAAAMGRGGDPSIAVKAREAAEDKAAAFSPSARNSLSALVLAARDNVGIGRPRVALKYLARLGDQLPAAAGPGEMLRDLLSLRAMEQGGSATAGQ